MKSTIEQIKSKLSIALSISPLDPGFDVNGVTDPANLKKIPEISSDSDVDPEADNYPPRTSSQFVSSLQE